MDNSNRVCNCINPCKGSTSGQTWEQRRYYFDRLDDFGSQKDDDTPKH